MGRIYLGEDADGKQLYRWVGRFPTKRERDEAVKVEREHLAWEGAQQLPNCEEYFERFLADCRRRTSAPRRTPTRNA